MTESRRRIAILLFGLLTLACSTDLPLNPNARHTEASVNRSEPTTALDSTAYLLAQALSDPIVRARLRNDLRDSPFKRHRIEFKSYIARPDGVVLSAKASSLIQGGESQLRSLFLRLPALELVLARPADRAFWNADSDLLVVSVPANVTANDSTTRPFAAFNTLGESFAISPTQFVRPAMFVLRPATDFPSNAEDVRRATPHQARGTVETLAEERANLLTDAAKEFSGSSPTTPRLQIICDPRGEYCYDDDPPPEVPQGGVDLDSWMTTDACFGYTVSLNSSNDTDNDLVLDDCEFPIAYALRPLLNLSTSDGFSDREPYWAVSRHPTKPNVLQIIYALAYHEDGGSWGVEAHTGDSEWIVFEVSNPIDSRWRLDFATLSAHWGTWADHTATYAAEDLEYTLIYRARPRIWRRKQSTQPIGPTEFAIGSTPAREAILRKILTSFPTRTWETITGRVPVLASNCSIAQLVGIGPRRMLSVFGLMHSSAAGFRTGHLHRQRVTIIRSLSSNFDNAGSQFVPGHNDRSPCDAHVGALRMQFTDGRWHGEFRWQLFFSFD